MRDSTNYSVHGYPPDFEINTTYCQLFEIPNPTYIYIKHVFLYMLILYIFCHIQYVILFKHVSMSNLFMCHLLSLCISSSFFFLFFFLVGGGGGEEPTICGKGHQHPLMECWGGFLYILYPFSYFSFQPVLHDWCNKGRGMCYPVCGMVNIKEPLLLIDKSSLCGGSGFSFSLSEWSLTICLMPYNRR